LSLPCERYYGPLRLPGQPAATSGATLIRRGGTPGVHWTGSPVVPCATIRACHPCYPGGSGRAGQLWGLVRHRPSPNVHRVGTLSLVTRLRLGSLHATACAVARPSGALVRELGALGYPAHLPQATWATLPTPRAGLPPASLTVSTACGRCQVKQVVLASTLVCPGNPVSMRRTRCIMSWCGGLSAPPVSATTPTGRTSAPASPPWPRSRGLSPGCLPGGGPRPPDPRGVWRLVKGDT
jgi:hypothetical protein